jgi:D-alanyl-D-alanine carboxypeptidase-like protein/putative peptidoglycan binding protein
MGDASFGPMWPNCDRSRIVTVVRHDGLRLPIHRDLADLVTLLMDLTELQGYDINPAWTWGYACRSIAGTNQPSFHSQGTAVDINAPTNPRRSDHRFVSDMPSWMVQLWKGHGFRWGGNFSWPDPMHFEFMGSVTQAHATAARIRAFLAAAGRPAPPPPGRRPVPPRGGYPGRVERGDTGRAVSIWQDMFRQRGYSIAVDGVFGPGTEAVVRDWQRSHHPPLTVDGIGGEMTWHSVLYA